MRLGPLPAISQTCGPSIVPESIANRPALKLLAIMVSKYFEAGYPNTTGFRKVVKATIMVKKKEAMSDEDFIQVDRPSATWVHE